MNVIIIALGGAIGAVCRYALSFLPVSSHFPFATFLTNVLGAFVMGLVIGLAEERRGLSTNLELFLKVGVCGGFTTFSTFSLETVRLIDRYQYGLAMLYSLTSLCCSLIALICGRYLATRLGGV